MWTREELKTRAKAVLKGSYWKAFLVSIILVFVGGSNGGPNLNWRINNSGGYRQSFPLSMIDNIGHMVSYITILIITIAVILLIIALRIFIGYSIEVSGRHYFIKSAEGNADLNNLGYSFKNGKYKNIIKGMLYRGVLVFLWTLLLVIPGIIKGYAYSMVPYILADNPNIGYKRAIEISNGMTDGEKGKMFVLDLSFIGWYLLGALALGIGVLFVNPYVNATGAELYLVLRQRAISNGTCSLEELNMDEFTK